MSDAYVETTVLTDLLLKPTTKKQDRAKAALARYDRTFLPVYAIKEWKAGPMLHYAWVHDKLRTTRSLAATWRAVAELPNYYRKPTATDAVAAAAVVSKRRQPKFEGLGDNDQAMADSYRLALASLIIRKWRECRRVTTQVIQDLECYVEAKPAIRKDGLLDLNPTLCEPDQECSLAPQLKAKPKLLEALRAAIPENSGKKENQNRRKALRQLIKHPNIVLDRETCRHLGDAVFAFFCPANAVILTTNLKDHAPLARALGKKAESPSESPQG
jgi:hypothetical protein